MSLFPNGSTPPQFGGLELSLKQQRVLDALSEVSNSDYPFANWYLGVLYSLEYTVNPERVAQAAQSVRELLEKLPRAIRSEPSYIGADWNQLRRNMEQSLERAKRALANGPRDAPLPREVQTLIEELDHYLSASKQPTRSESTAAALAALDPLEHIVPAAVKGSSRQEREEIWKYMQKVAHHQTAPTSEEFLRYIEKLDDILLEALVKTATADQLELKSLFEKSTLSEKEVKRGLVLLKKSGSNYRFFFEHAKSDRWLDALDKDGRFDDCTNIVIEGTESIRAVYWHPLTYLSAIVNLQPGRVVDILNRSLAKTDNPRALREVLEIANQMHEVDVSAKLAQTTAKYLSLPHRWEEPHLVVQLMKKWAGGSRNSRDAAVKLVGQACGFNAKNCSTPAFRFSRDSFAQILSEGVAAVSEASPVETARRLIQVMSAWLRAAALVHEGQNCEKHEIQNSLTDVWELRGYEPSTCEELLANGVLEACLSAYKFGDGFCCKTDQLLKNTPWRLFERIRQYVFSQCLTETSRTHIHAYLVQYPRYGGPYSYSYEFQLMARKAVEHFGRSLLTEQEVESIQTSILTGPPKQDYLRNLGNVANAEERFLVQQKKFHLAQLKPFGPLLQPSVFIGLNENEEPTDEDYGPRQRVSGGMVSQRSPYTVEQLRSFGDKELLQLLNDWNSEGNDANDWLIEYTFDGLARAFSEVFTCEILLNEDRRHFWFSNKHKIARPIYIAHMIDCFSLPVEIKTTDILAEYFDFCSWAVDLEDILHVDHQTSLIDTLDEYPDWSSTRRAVADFVAKLLEEDVEEIFPLRSSMADIVQRLCVKGDPRLDSGKRVFLSKDNPVLESINQTRSRVLGTLVELAAWESGKSPNHVAVDATAVLELRFSGVEVPCLTRPEYAMLGRKTATIFNLDRNWFLKHVDDLFPYQSEDLWQAAFSGFIKCTAPHPAFYHALEKSFQRAANYSDLLRNLDDGADLLTALGRHLLCMYLWGEDVPLEESLLSKYYVKAGSEFGASLLHFVARSHELPTGGRDDVLCRLRTFVDWRVREGAATELKHVKLLLLSDALGSQWALEKYFEVLKKNNTENQQVVLDYKRLAELQADHPELVLSCLEEFVNLKDVYFPFHHMNALLTTAEKDENQELSSRARRVRERLVTIGASVFLPDLDEENTLTDD